MAAWRIWGAIAVGLALAQALDLKKSPPVMPPHFEANLEITSHLVDRSVSYPPWLRRIKVRYDYAQKVARADILAGYDKGKTYIRRYDNKKEYMVKYGEYKNCERAYLGEEMPLPQFPDDLQFQGTELIQGVKCGIWVSEDAHANVRVHVYERLTDRAPIRLIQESKMDGEWSPLVTFDLLDMKVQPQVPLGPAQRNYAHILGSLGL
ncbi:hypothetical protein ACHHYP_09589 [Achlya hypogyna]|uniref:Secreted protein n=1 Tax=Achlya hypogyna TaxID=1202772 RepID=A0A1V9YMZ9_ACHHY|nr:hypothetical protein ACHHYP_09589 [Achlya hypogyna]